MPSSIRKGWRLSKATPRVLEAVYDDVVRLGLNATGVGFFAVAPVARPSAYTQTYATADKTHANATGAAVVTTAVTQASPFGYAGAAQGDAVATTINQIIVDLADLKQLVNSVIDDLQALGLAQ